jgi:hypothetical protein
MNLLKDLKATTEIKSNMKSGDINNGGFKDDLESSICIKEQLEVIKHLKSKK